MSIRQPTEREREEESERILSAIALLEQRLASLRVELQINKRERDAQE